MVYNHLGPSDLDLWRFDGWSENDGGGLKEGARVVLYPGNDLSEGARVAPRR